MRRTQAEKLSSERAPLGVPLSRSRSGHLYNRATPSTVYVPNQRYNATRGITHSQFENPSGPSMRVAWCDTRLRPPAEAAWALFQAPQARPKPKNIMKSMTLARSTSGSKVGYSVRPGAAGEIAAAVGSLIGADTALLAVYLALSSQTKQATIKVFQLPASPLRGKTSRLNLRLQLQTASSRRCSLRGR